MTPVLLVAAGFLAGSIPFGVLITRWRLGVDVRSQGSGNIGATNVARVGGKKMGVLVLALDALKGAGPVLLALSVAPQARLVHAAVGLAAFLGHVFPPWLRFRGGKGVATALGMLLVLTPLPALAAAGTYAVLFALWRVSSVGSLAAGAVAVTVATLLSRTPREYAALVAVVFVLMLFTHRSNIGRIVRKTEKGL